MSVQIVTEPDGSKWVPLEAFEKQTQRLVEFHQQACTADNCILDGGDEHQTAFSDNVSVCPQCDGIGKTYSVYGTISHHCSLCKGTSHFG